MAPELAISRWVDLVIFATESNQPLDKDRVESLSLCGSCHMWVAHYSVRHLTTALGKSRVAPDFRTELESPLILDRARHVH